MNHNAVLAKLRMKSGQRAIIIGAPDSYKPVLAAIPEGVEVAETLEGQFDFIQVFVTQKGDAERQAPALKAAMKRGALLWVSYPKGKSIPTDLNRDILWQALGDFGLQGVAMIAIDEVWSAMRLKSV